MPGDLTAAQKQEVELLIKAGTERLKSIGQLVNGLEALEQNTGEASEKLESLAGGLKALRDQQKLVKQFADLKSQTKQLGTAQEDAKTQATELGRALAATEKPTKPGRTTRCNSTACTPVFPIPAGAWGWDNKTIGYSSQWEPQPEYNAVFVSGVTQGMTIEVIHQGTAGYKAAPDVFGDLNMDAYQCRERGLATITATGNQEIATEETVLPNQRKPGPD